MRLSTIIYLNTILKLPNLCFTSYISGGDPMARVSKVARLTNFNDTRKK